MASNPSVAIVREMLRAAFKAHGSQGKRELLQVVASVLQEELIGDREETCPYSGDLERIMRSVIFALNWGNCDRTAMKEGEVVYVRHNLAAGTESLLQHAAGNSI